MLSQLISLNAFAMIGGTALGIALLWWAGLPSVVQIGWILLHTLSQLWYQRALSRYYERSTTAPAAVFRRDRTVVEVIGIGLGIENGLLPLTFACLGVREPWMAAIMLVTGLSASNVAVGFGRNQKWLYVSVPMLSLAAVSGLVVGDRLGFVVAVGIPLMGAALYTVNKQVGRAANELIRLRFELQRGQDDWSSQAVTDALTGLPNRLGLRASVTDRQAKALSVLFIDLDGFKAVNDQFGHDVGDHVLQVVASRLNEMLRTDDAAFRIGGDEFVIVTQSPQLGINELANRIEIELAKPIMHGGRSLRIGASIGTARTSETLDIDEAIRQADRHMYEQKSERRGAQLNANFRVR
jgi:diguanylate cyclase (GGDEF)-like protein